MKATSGTAKECLRHFTAHAADADQAMGAIASFTGANQHNTVRKWWQGKRLPSGEFLVKLRYFLEANGYRVTELDRLHPAVRDIGKLIAHGALDFDDAVRELSIRDRDGLLDYLHGRTQPRKTLVAHMERLFEQLRDKLDSRSLFPQPTTEGLRSPSLQSAKTTDGKLIHAIVALLNAIQPLARHLLTSDDPTDRVLLREQAGSTLFETQVLLVQLCDEEARKQYGEQGGNR